MDTILQDLRAALRSIATQRVLTAVMVATLALGIGANTAVFSLVNAVLIRPLPFPDASRLVLIWGNQPRSGYEQLPISLPNAVDVRARSRSLDGVAVWTSFADTKFNLGGPGEPEKVQYGIASSELFSLLGAEPARGRLFVTDDDVRGRAGGVVVSDRLWRRLFPGGREIDGATVTLDARPMAIVGVLPAGFRFASFPRDPDVWLPLGLDPGADWRPYARGASSLGVVARLARDATLEGAREEMRGIAADLAREYPTFNRDWTLSVVSLREQVVRSTRPAVLAMLGAVVMVLLIACANVANLLLGRAVARQRELAVRAALGAGAGRLVRQVLAESASVAALGAGLGILLASWLLDFPAAVAIAAPSVFVPYQVAAGEIGIDGSVLLFTAAVAVGTTLLVGLAPALRAARLDPAESLRGAAVGSDGTRRVRTALVIGEIALSVTLLAGAGLLIRSFGRLTDIDPGFRADHVLTADLNLPAGRYDDGARTAAFFRTLVERAAALPGVRAAGAVEQRPFSGPTQSTDFRIIGAPEPPEGQAPSSPYGAATAGYFTAMGIATMRGRGLDASDGERTPRIAVVNETFAGRFFPGEDPIGKRIALSIEALRFERPNAPPRLDFLDAAREIVGVVADVRQEGMSVPPAPMVYVPAAQRASRDMTLTILATGDPLALVPRVRGAVAAIDPGQPLTAVSTMRQVVAGALGEPRSRTALATVFAALATVLTAIGIYGVISYAVARRRHELGVRLALGAGRRDVVLMVVREGFALAGAGSLIGLVGALVSSRALAGMLYEVRPTDVVTLSTVIGFVFVVSIGASWLPAWRASRVNPMEALRVD